MLWLSIMLINCCFCQGVETPQFFFSFILASDDILKLTSSFHSHYITLVCKQMLVIQCRTFIFHTPSHPPFYAILLPLVLSFRRGIQLSRIIVTLLNNNVQHYFQFIVVTQKTAKVLSSRERFQRVDHALSDSSV